MKSSSATKNIYEVEESSVKPSVHESLSELSSAIKDVEHMFDQLSSRLSFVLSEEIEEEHKNVRHSSDCTLSGELQDLAERANLVSWKLNSVLGRLCI